MSGTPADGYFFGPERSALQAFENMSSSALTVILIGIAALIFLAAFKLPPLWKAVLISWLVLP